VSHDLFAPKTNGRAYLAPIEDPFRWCVTVFGQGGATEIIKRAKGDLKTYYLVRRKFNGDYVPLFANYLFIEFKEGVTLEPCRTTTKFIRVISARDHDSDISRPILVRRGAIADNMS
jgi:hypothetical protein